MSIFQQTLEQSDERPRRGHQQSYLSQLLDKVATYLAVQREKSHEKTRTQVERPAITHLDLPQTLSYLCQVGQGIFNQ